MPLKKKKGERKKIKHCFEGTIYLQSARLHKADEERRIN